MSRARIYLAGPEVFLADAAAAGARKKALCAAAGFEGLFPLDAGLAQVDALAIYRANRAMMLSADAVVANLTPFRGPSADAGTVFELGLMAGLGRGVFGYSNVAADFEERTRAGCVGTWFDAGRGWVDGEGMAIEAFGLGDNLMIDGVLAEGGGLVRRDVPAGARWTDLGGFSACLALVGEWLGGGVRGLHRG